MLEATGTLEGTIYSQGQWIKGTVSWSEGVITQVNGEVVSGDALESPLIVPGFIDLHVHGGGGRDFMEGGDASETIRNCHLKYGTTSMLATTMTAPHTDIVRALEGISQIESERYHSSSPRKPMANLLGIHLEGPYINPDKLGAQPDMTRPANLPELELYHQLVPMKVITLAPELLQDDIVMKWLREHDVRTQAGHSLATYEQGCEALAKGLNGFTHLFNAMPPLHHRSPGLVGAVFAHAEFSEIIPDLLHVHPGAILAALRAIPSLYCVTDGTAASGMPDGQYALGSQQVYKCENGVRLADGGLAGSCLTMDVSLRNLVSIGLSLGEAVERVSTIPANYLNALNKGRITTGASADFAVLDADLNITNVVCEGQQISH